MLDQEFYRGEIKKAVFRNRTKCIQLSHMRRWARTEEREMLNRTHLDLLIILPWRNLSFNVVLSN